MRRTAIEQFLDNLSAGDPVAVAIAVGFGLLLAIAGGVAFYDRRQRQKEQKGEGRP